MELTNDGLDLPSTSDDCDRDLVRLRRVKCELEDQRKGDREEEREPHDRCNTAPGGSGTESHLHIRIVVRERPVHIARARYISIAFRRARAMCKLPT